MADAPPPPPPPHGANPKSTSGGLPDGNYDIFIIPPHSSGSGFLYLPSLQPQRNSFIAGFACAVFCYLIWVTAVPVLGQWLSIIAASGSAGVLLLVAGVGAVAWAFGKTQGESKHQRPHSPPPPGGSGGAQGNADTEGGSKHGRTNSGPYNASHSSGSDHTHSAPPPRTPRQDYSTPPPRQDYRPPPQSGHYSQPPSDHNAPPRPQPPPDYAAPPPSPPPPQPQPQPEYNAPPRYTAPPPPPTPQQETSKPTPPPQRKPAPPPAPSPEPQARSASDAAASWEKAREETRKREEARKKAEELKKSREEALRKKEEAERQEKAANEKRKWEQARAREKEAREREARERELKNKETKDQETREKERREREARERIARDKKEKAAAAAEAAKSPKPTIPASKKYERPSAQSYASTETTSAYDARTVISSSTASSYTETLSSYAPSTSTARTSPPPEYRGPYNTSDPDKIVMKAVYMYNNTAPKKPISQLVSGEANVTDGLVLKINTEGLFIDDDVRRVPQREWDVKAWSLKGIERGTFNPHYILRATIRDTEGKYYIFVIPSDQEWKVDVGLARLRKGNLVRSMGMSSIKAPEMKGLLSDLGWI
ncbi:hypothetical protein KCU99_g7620, partial [Aureobasidium melanogenum]